MHDADAVGERRQGLFARGFEQPLRFEALFQLLKSKLQRALPHQVDFLDVNLIFTALFVDADAPAHGDLQAVLGPELPATLLLQEVAPPELTAVLVRDADDADVVCVAAMARVLVAAV